MSKLSAILSFVAVSLLVALSAQANAAPARPPEAANAAEADAPDPTVLRALQAGLAGSFDKYLAELLPDRCETPEQKSQLQRYEWKRFSTQSAWYVADPKQPTFTVVKRQAQGEGKVKLFIKDLKNKDAMPRPIELVKKAGRWFISSNSL